MLMKRNTILVGLILVSSFLMGCNDIPEDGYDRYFLPCIILDFSEHLNFTSIKEILDSENIHNEIEPFGSKINNFESFFFKWSDNSEYNLTNRTYYVLATLVFLDNSYAEGWFRITIRLNGTYEKYQYDSPSNAKDHCYLLEPSLQFVLEVLQLSSNPAPQDTLYTYF